MPFCFRKGGRHRERGVGDVWMTVWLKRGALKVGLGSWELLL